jgi:hypothetical protein
LYTTTAETAEVAGLVDMVNAVQSGGLHGTRCEMAYHVLKIMVGFHQFSNELMEV